MRCQLTRDYRFEAAHSLPRVPEGHKCARLHGHSYRISLVVEGEVGEDTGWVVDFGELDRVVDPIIARLDHRTLNDIPGLENPTSELLCVWLWREIQPQLPILREISVAETRDSRCSYRGE